MALGIAAVIIGVTALAFALFGWSTAAHPLLGDSSRYPLHSRRGRRHDKWIVKAA